MIVSPFLSLFTCLLVSLLVRLCCRFGDLMCSCFVVLLVCRVFDGLDVCLCSYVLLVLFVFVVLLFSWFAVLPFAVCCLLV